MKLTAAIAAVEVGTIGVGDIVEAVDHLACGEG